MADRPRTHTRDVHPAPVGPRRLRPPPAAFEDGVTGAVVGSRVVEALSDPFREAHGDGITREPQALEDVHTYIRNLAAWLTAR